MSNKTTTNTIANRLHSAHDNINQACKNSSRSSSSVQLMAVSKTKPVTAIQQAYDAGQRIFGENYAQELAQKAEHFRENTDIEWHYIGPIQSNKTALLCRSCNWIDSVDRAKIADRLNRHAEALGKRLNVLIQVNVSRSEQKSGVVVEELAALAQHILRLPHLRLRGLMAIPDQYPDENRTKAEFNAMQTCFNELKQQYPEVDTLSLGMSGDLDLAIASGSTLVRIGTAIFGEREAK